MGSAGLGMEIYKVSQELVCTKRSPGLGFHSLRVLEAADGSLAVATDPVGAPAGKWVFTTIGTAARYAMSDPSVVTDLTICGLIDNWE
ncbi:MAG: carboxysome peptide B [Burkholderiaceae bacterium]|jgi:ethanolamine utilization protein EutN